ncbi:iron-only hydrogenase maturation protein HydF [Phascolarctobacterium faecium DSM 14760]|jgi:[FeFe] hydrogenase H-cluster maturation GTPase HydF|uniref:[FeFe] hydrogenase H-cluster maturation GTPase HydF n=1 Tax=Phascolarctobacterium faecium TaxID=33025 RepID=UPI000DC2EEA0|nr:[FeFe] hydrogenase H-cluster maturation GTPase HydF [Phascolarctobacterium faecium]RAS55822.1 iron-only hydrogenase maturation protein HydF [Phascolarctobacterium faecium DSM 14760]
MSLNATPSSERVHIGIFGKRNAGKSSLINAITGQNLAIVSEAKGTTTDPVYKAMELLPLGPVMIIDTPGIDDEGVLGSLRIQKAYQVLNKTDIALVIIDAAVGPSAEDLRLIKRINAKKIPLLIVINKCETINEDKKTAYQALLPNRKLLFVSAEQKLNIFELKEAITQTVPADENKAQIVADLLSPSDFVVLVVPIDSAAPKGRLILPQQQTIRDILEADAAAIVVKENELTNTLQNLGKRPKLVITDSQVFKKVAAETPADILLTSFSILFARYKGNLQTAVQGVTALESLEDGDKILVGEGCTHHRQCDDIGTVKLPRWIKEYTGKNPEFIFTSGTEFPLDLSPYKIIIHCGACMLNEREMQYRIKCAADQNIPFTNYGITIAYINGILKRTVEPFPQIYKLLDK